jgi:hypothetical protein
VLPAANAHWRFHSNLNGTSRIADQCTPKIFHMAAAEIEHDFNDTLGMTGDFMRTIENGLFGISSRRRLAGKARSTAFEAQHRDRK